MEDLLRDFPVVIEVPVAWGHMDAFQHVNNTVYFRFFESARIAYFERVGYMDAMARTGVGPILASTQCRFKLPLTYPDQVSVGARISELEADRFLMLYRLVSQRHGKIAAEGDGWIVSYNYRQQRRAPVQDDVRERIRALEGVALKTKSEGE